MSDFDISSLFRARTASAIIENKLFLGGLSATSHAFLQKINATHVLSITDDPFDKIDSRFKHLHIDEPDIPSTDLLSKMDHLTDWIDGAISQGGCVVVHCTMGMSRSATIVIAYLMKKNKWSVDQTIDHVVAKRSIVCPNHGFKTQLEYYHKMNYSLLGDTEAHATVMKFTRPGGRIDVIELYRLQQSTDPYPFSWGGN